MTSHEDYMEQAESLRRWSSGREETDMHSKSYTDYLERTLKESEELYEAKIKGLLMTLHNVTIAGWDYLENYSTMETYRTFLVALKAANDELKGYDYPPKSPPKNFYPPSDDGPPETGIDLSSPWHS